MGRWKQIVVGVDSSPASRTALEWASDEAVHHWTATKVKVGTICVHVLSYSRKYGSAH
jgi:nucleotide-binding universal stress UspA family protein